MPFTNHLWIVLILLVVLLIFGPSRLPELGSAIGRALREFRSGMGDLQDHVQGSGPGSASSTPTASSEPVETKAPGDTRS